MKKILLCVLALTGVLNTGRLNAQNSCTSAVTADVSTTCRPQFVLYDSGRMEYWFKFTADDTTMNVQVAAMGMPIGMNTFVLELYSGDCSNLILLGSATGLPNVSLTQGGLVPGTDYIAKLYYLNPAELPEFWICVVGKPTPEYTVLTMDSTCVPTEGFVTLKGEGPVYSFTATSASAKIKVGPSALNDPDAVVSSISLYSSNMTLIKQVWADSLVYDSLTVGEQYIVKLQFETGGYFEVCAILDILQWQVNFYWGSLSNPYSNASLSLSLEPVTGYSEYTEPPSICFPLNGYLDLIPEVITPGKIYHFYYSYKLIPNKTVENPPETTIANDPTGWIGSNTTVLTASDFLNAGEVPILHQTQITQPGRYLLTVYGDLREFETYGTLNDPIDDNPFSDPGEEWPLNPVHINTGGLPGPGNGHPGRYVQLILQVQTDLLGTPILPTVTLSEGINPLSGAEPYKVCPGSSISVLSTPNPYPYGNTYWVYWETYNSINLPPMDMYADNISHLYTQNGTHHICVNYAMEQGFYDCDPNLGVAPGTQISIPFQVCHDIKVGYFPSFTTAPEDICEDANMIFTPHTICDNTNNYLTLTWNLGDGTTVVMHDLGAVQHVYAYAGQYAVSLTVQDQYGNTETVTQNVTVHSVAPPPVIVGLNNTCEGYTYGYEFAATPNTLNTTWQVFPHNSYVTVTPNITTGGITVVWDPTYFNSTNFTPASVVVNSTNEFGCENSSSMLIFPCCEWPPDVTPMNNVTINQSNNPTLDGLNVGVNGILAINTSKTITGAHFFMGPEAQISINPDISVPSHTNVVTFENCTFKMGRCYDYMWKGIFVNSPVVTVNLDNCPELKDALTGINASNNGAFVLHNCTFTDNYINVKVSDYTPQNENPVPYNAQIYGNTFTGSNSLTHEPCLGTKTLAGVEAENVSGLTIGDETQAANTFTNMRFGVRNYNSWVNVCNNNFSNIRENATSMSPADNAVIYAEKNIPSYVNYPVDCQVNVGGSIAKRNHITNSNVGIYGINLYGNISYNNISTRYNAVTMKELNKKKSTVINSNNINVSSGGTTTGTAVWAENTIPVMNGIKLDISHNTISGCKTGIWVRNLYSFSTRGVTIGDNQVTLGTALNTVSRVGVKIQNCDAVDVGWNSVSVQGGGNANAATRTTGIMVQDTKDGKIHDNGTLFKLNSGIRTYGNCTNTGFTCNTMQRCYNGFYFDNASVITDQGSTTINSANKWIANINYKLNAATTNAISPNKYWYYNGNSGVQQNPNPLPPTLITALLITYPNSHAFDMCIANPNGGNNNGGGNREARFGRIVRNENSYPVFPTELSTFDKHYLYRELKKEPALLNLGLPDDALYTAVYDSLGTTTTGMFNDVYSKIENDSILDAATTNSGIAPQNLIDQNRYVVNEIYLNTFAQGLFTLDSTTVATLDAIAQQAPWEGGDAVYFARAMLGVDYDNNNGNGNKEMEEADENVSISTLLFPNPASKEIFIELEDLSSVEIEVYDMMGSCVLKGKVEQGKAVSVANLQNGLYLYKLSSNNEEIETGKLCIIR